MKDEIIIKDKKYYKQAYKEMFERACDYKWEITELKIKIEELEKKCYFQERALIKLMIKHHYDSIIIWGHVVIDMSNYTIIKKQKPEQTKLF